MKLSVQIQLFLCFKPWQEIKNLKVFGFKNDLTLALEAATPHLPSLLLDSQKVITLSWKKESFPSKANEEGHRFYQSNNQAESQTDIFPSANLIGSSNVFPQITSKQESDKLQFLCIIYNLYIYLYLCVLFYSIFYFMQIENWCIGWNQIISSMRTD